MSITLQFKNAFENLHMCFIRVELPYNVALVSEIFIYVCMYIFIYIYPFLLESPTYLGYHQAPSWAPYSIHRFPVAICSTQVSA